MEPRSNTDVVGLRGRHDRQTSRIDDHVSASSLNAEVDLESGFQHFNNVPELSGPPRNLAPSTSLGVRSEQGFTIPLGTAIDS